MLAYQSHHEQMKSRLDQRMRIVFQEYEAAFHQCVAAVASGSDPALTRISEETGWSMKPTQSNSNSNDVEKKTAVPFDCADARMRAMELAADFSEAQSGMQNAFEKGEELLSQRFEGVLSQLDGAILTPIVCILSVKGRPWTIHVSLAATDTLMTCTEKIRAHIAELGDSIVCESSPPSFHLLSDGLSNSHTVLDGVATVGSLEQLSHGSHIQLRWGFVLKSEDLLKCFAKVFDKTKDERVDYFKCQTCSINWYVGCCFVKSFVFPGHNCCFYSNILVIFFSERRQDNLPFCCSLFCLLFC